MTTATATRSEPAPVAQATWRPHEGSQRAFMACPVWEVLYEGQRGPGKSDALLMDFAQHVGQGYGRFWRGILFRREIKHLDDLISKSKRWFFQIFPEARWLSSGSDYKWVWPDGEELLFRQMKHVDDYWNYHGHEYPWIGWDELTNYPDDQCYEQMKSCSRSSHPSLPRKYRSTANPWGAGHGWVKARFVDPGPEGTIILDGEGEARMRISGKLHENPNIFENDPRYVRTLRAVKNPELRKAWLDGDWDVNPGGFLQGIWDRDRHAIKAFDIPDDWTRWRTIDWGFARPFSVGWYAMDFDGVIYRYRELYGWGGKPNVGKRWNATRVAREIRKCEAEERQRGITFYNNPADPNLWQSTGVQVRGKDVTPALQMEEKGVSWIPARKGPGSRVASAQVVVEKLSEDMFFVFNTCRHWIRTVPSLQYDPDNWEDVDTEQEDHAWDETRYALTSHQHKPDKPKPAEKKPKYGTFEYVLEVTSNRKDKSPYRLK